MHTPHAKLSRKISIGVITAGFAALSVATALPASAETRQLISGVGPTYSAAYDDASNRCSAGGGYAFGEPGVTSHQNSDGSYVITGTCFYL